MSEELAPIIDFVTRKRLDNNRVRNLSRSEEEELMAKAATKFAAQLSGNVEFEREVDDERVAMAMKLLSDTEEDVLRHGVRTLIVFERIGATWAWKWANVSQDPRELLKAVGPIYLAALESSKARERTEPVITEGDNSTEDIDGDED